MRRRFSDDRGSERAAPAASRAMSISRTTDASRARSGAAAATAASRSFADALSAARSVTWPVRECSAALMTPSAWSSLALAVRIAVLSLRPQ